MIFSSVKEASKDTFVYSGRAERLEHWSFLLFTAICIAIFQVLGVYEISTIFPLNWVILLVFFWIVLANVSLMVRRLHDHGLSGFWLFLLIVPLFMLLISARALYGSGVSILDTEAAELLFKISQAFLVSLLIAFGSLYVRPGDKKANKYGGPVF
jgi:uncharacterized membrane protein YhaH (DUF805 family)